MNQRNLAAIVALVVALPIAIWLGIAIVQEQVQTVLYIMGAAFVLLCLALKRHVWILIPAALGMQGNLNVLPGAPAPWHLMTVVVGAFMLIRVATRQQRFHFRWSGMETAVFLVMLSLLQAFLRNPTGFMIFGGELAGGKPYLIYCAALGAFVIIGMADADIRSFRWAVLAMIFVGLMDGTLAIITAYIPDLSGYLVRYYSNVNIDASTVSTYTTDLADARIGQFAQPGIILGTIACTFWRPVAALDMRKPWRMLFALGGVILTVLSGFRGNTAVLYTRFVVGSLLRGKVLDVIAVTVAGLLGVLVLLVAVPQSSLPYSVQRVMTVIPGYQARADIELESKHSKEIRMKMWKTVMKGDRFIENKLLGDGFQQKRSESDLMVQWVYGDKKVRDSIPIEEILLANGAYHGFHVETIRYTGIIGLIAATGALIAFAVFAFRCIRIFSGRPEWGYVMFICLPFLIHPIWYWGFFGDYKTQFPTAIATAGIIKLLWMINRRERNME